MSEHEFGEIPHDWFQLDVQVVQHLISETALNWIDDVTIDFSTQEFHGTCGAQGSRGDILGFKYQVLTIELDGGLEGLGYHCDSYVFPPPCWHHDTVQRVGRWCVVLFQLEDAPKQCLF